MAQTGIFKIAQNAAFGVALGLAGAVSFAGSADAATCQVAAVTVNGAIANDCNGPIAGNDTGNKSTFLDDLNAGDIFAGFGNVDLLAGWDLFGKSDDGDLSVTADEGMVTGSFAASGVSDTLVVTLKSGISGFSAFLFTGVVGPDITGTFSMFLAELLGPQGQAQDLSHLSIFSATALTGGGGGGGGGGGTSEVPLPAAGWMLLAGLGGLAAARRRRKS